MRHRRIALLLTDQRGVVLPMSMLVLLILSALVIAFSVLSASEPTIANNHLMTAQARALAEAGLEQAIWALNNLAEPLPAPYDGSQLVAVSSGGTAIGGFRVTVANGSVAYERIITAVGWVPNDTTTARKAHQKVTVTVINLQDMFKDPPAALAVRGELQMGGNARIDSRADTSCGPKDGTVSSDTTLISSGAVEVFGRDGDPGTPAYDASAPRPNGAPYDPSNPDKVYDAVQAYPTSKFDQYIFTDADLNALRTLAKARGTYLQGTVDFNSSHKLPGGLVFVDTTTGTNITGSTPRSEFADVTIHGNAGSGDDNTSSGWLIVNGSLTMSGNTNFHGLIYIQNDLTYHGVGDSEIDGAIISRNILDTVPNSIDSQADGNAKIKYNCSYAKKGGGSISGGWTMKSGSYMEVSGS